MNLGACMSRLLGKEISSREQQAVLQRESCLYASCYCEENVYKLIEQLTQNGVPLHQLFAVFISNHAKKVPLWCQKSSADGPGGDGLVVWDYHVILVQHLEQPSILSNHSPAGRAGSSGSSAAAAGSPAGAPATKTSVTAPACNSHGRGGTASGQAGGGLPPGGALVWDLDSVLSFPCSGQEYATRALRCGQMRHLAHQFWRGYRVVPAAVYLEYFASDRSHMWQPKPKQATLHDTHHSQGTPHAASSSHHPTHGDHSQRSQAADADASLHGSWDEDFEWLAPQPPWPQIVAKDGTTMNLDRYWDMSEEKEAHETQHTNSPSIATSADLNAVERTTKVQPTSDAQATTCTLSSSSRFGAVYREAAFVSDVLRVRPEGLVGLHGWAISDPDEWG